MLDKSTGLEFEGENPRTTMLLAGCCCSEGGCSLSRCAPRRWCHAMQSFPARHYLFHSHPRRWPMDGAAGLAGLAHRFLSMEWRLDHDEPRIRVPPSNVCRGVRRIPDSHRV